jgi:hypothetical protein
VYGLIHLVSVTGPGCSSVGDGLLTELGPFRVSSSGNLTLNKHSWNKGKLIIQIVIRSSLTGRVSYDLDISISSPQSTSHFSVC